LPSIDPLQLFLLDFEFLILVAYRLGSPNMSSLDALDALGEKVLFKIVVALNDRL
jgi:hypothetical protein